MRLQCQGKRLAIRRLLGFMGDLTPGSFYRDFAEDEKLFAQNPTRTAPTLSILA